MQSVRREAVALNFVQIAMAIGIPIQHVRSHRWDLHRKVMTNHNGELKIGVPLRIEQNHSNAWNYKNQFVRQNHSNQFTITFWQRTTHY